MDDFFDRVGRDRPEPVDTPDARSLMAKIRARQQLAGRALSGKATTVRELLDEIEDIEGYEWLYKR